MANDSLTGFLLRARSVAVLARAGATQGEQQAAANALARFASKARTLAEQAPEPERSRFVGLLRRISPVLVSELGDPAVAAMPGSTATGIGAGRPGPSFLRAARADRTRVARPASTEAPRSSPQFRIGVWVLNKRTGRAAVIQERARPRATPLGPEHLFIVDGDGRPLERGWHEFDLRLATDQEIAVEQASRAAAKEKREREQAEWEAEWDAQCARLKNLKTLRHGAELYAVAARPWHKSEQLCGNAWDGKHYVVFEAMNGVIKKIRIVGSKAAATRTYNAATNIGCASLDVSDTRFDELCHQLVELAKASSRRRQSA